MSDRASDHGIDPRQCRPRRVGGIALGLLIALGVVSAAVGEPGGDRLFRDRVGAILESRCGACHGADAQEGGLRVDAFAGLAKGGRSGGLIVPGSADESLIVQAIRRSDASLAMPPDEPLSAAEIESIERWINTGALHPEGPIPLPESTIDLAAARDFWSLRPLVASASAARPDPSHGDKPAAPGPNPIDRLIGAELALHGLEPAIVADRPTLIRRAAFDLTGLPPTPAEIDRFVADDAPDAFERLLDRLLASPHYGEHWGRHWLDVARYADSNGLDENVAHGNAWRYRDYVIASFNADKPFDAFLREQVAGDLLIAPGETGARRGELLVATGFLSLGPKSLAEGDQQKLLMDVIDEQLDTLGRAFLGLSLGCARCHDHKFDPVSQADYYALAGIFKSTRTMESLARLARWHENVLDDPAERGDPADRGDQAETATAMGVTEGDPEDLRIHLRGSHLALGRKVARGLPSAISLTARPSIPPAASGRLELADWLVAHPLTARVIANRLWRWHFGRGLAASPDNLGRTGEPATHPELLDRLAAELVDADWSLKRLHRLIMTSRTWQRSSDPDTSPTAADCRRIDPDNRLWWRADVRRLEAEALRDAILAVSGRLDPTTGGSLLHVGNRKFLFDHTSKDDTRYDSPRRSIYLPVIRNHIADGLWLFDCTDGAVSSGDRATSTVASQALYLLNAELLLEAADAIAESAVTATPSDPRMRTALLWRRVLGREPEAAEREVFERRLQQLATEMGVEPQQPAVWSAAAQALLAGNEFLIVR